MKKTSKVNYLIDMHNKKKRKRVFHVNLLKKFYVFEQTVGFAQEGVEEENGNWNKTRKLKVTL